MDMEQTLKPQTLNPNLKSQTPNRKPYTPNPKPEAPTPNPKPQSLNPKPPTQNNKPQTPDPKPPTQDPKPQTLNPEPPTENPKPILSSGETEVPQGLRFDRLTGFNALSTSIPDPLQNAKQWNSHCYGFGLGFRVWAFRA